MDFGREQSKVLDFKSRTLVDFILIFYCQQKRNIFEYIRDNSKKRCISKYTLDFEPTSNSGKKNLE